MAVKCNGFTDQKHYSPSLCSLPFQKGQSLVGSLLEQEKDCNSNGAGHDLSTLPFLQKPTTCPPDVLTIPSGEKKCSSSSTSVYPAPYTVRSSSLVLSRSQTDPLKTSTMVSGHAPSHPSPPYHKQAVRRAPSIKETVVVVQETVAHTDRLPHIGSREGKRKVNMEPKLTLYQHNNWSIVLHFQYSRTWNRVHCKPVYFTLLCLKQ